MASGLTSVEFVTVGNPGNAPDTRYNGISVGSVNHVYQMGKYEITAGQYTEFLNAVAQDDPNGLYNTDVSAPIGYRGANIQRSGASPNFTYSVDADWANRPVNWTSFWDVARFANWLHNGQPVGAQGPETTEGGAYHDVGNQMLFGRNHDAKFFIPTEDEWYKAAYHNKDTGLAASYFDYPTGSNTAPINTLPNPGNHANFHDLFGKGNHGDTIDSPYFRTNVGEFVNSASPYGTFDQAGNLWEWNETAVTSSYRGMIGGGFETSSVGLQASNPYNRDYPEFEGYYLGFRVAAAVPEPSTAALAVIAFGLMGWRRKRFSLSWARRACRCRAALVLLALPLGFAGESQADVFHMAPGLTSVEFATVGNPGNAPDTRYNGISVGSVDHVYQIGKYEVTAGQYTEFLNAVAKADPNGLYNAYVGDPTSSLGANIVRTGSSPNFSYSVAPDWANRPVNYVNFWNTARFANWLHNGQPTGPQGPSTTEGGAYHDVGNQLRFGRNPGAKFFIPTEDEWYKTAYHNKSAGLSASYFDYPTGSSIEPINTLPDPGNHASYYGELGTVKPAFTIDGPYYRTEVGAFVNSGSPYGTFDQGGNVTEWNETSFGSTRGLRGGSIYTYSFVLRAPERASDIPVLVDWTMGFRVASVPEPTTAILAMFACGLM
jgi:formylglycine-generating enzyme required for sulfatase activity